MEALKNEIIPSDPPELAEFSEPREKTTVGHPDVNGNANAEKAAAPRAAERDSKKEARPTQTPARPKTAGNSLRKLRMERMLSKAELARRAGISTLTLDRIERGMPSRMDTKRKILEALGMTPDDRASVFGDDDD